MWGKFTPAVEAKGGLQDPPSRDGWGVTGGGVANPNARDRSKPLRIGVDLRRLGGPGLGATLLACDRSLEVWIGAYWGA